MSSRPREKCDNCENSTFYIESLDGELLVSCTECSQTSVYEPDLYKRPSKIQLLKYEKMLAKIKKIIETGP